MGCRVSLSDTFLLLAIGAFAGVVNTIAGGGSLVTVPALIFLGMSANAANATNRVGVLLQSGAAAARYRRDGVLDLRRCLGPLAWSSAGATAGAFWSVDIDETVFRRIIGVAMLAVLAVLLAGPERWLREGPPPRHRRWSSPLLFLAVGAYGGFLQAGVGVFLLALLVLVEGRDLLRANALKVLLVGGFTLPPLVVFAAHDLVDWWRGLALALGSAVGGTLGARMTVRWGPPLVRWVMVVVVVGSAAKLFLE